MSDFLSGLLNGPGDAPPADLGDWKIKGPDDLRRDLDEVVPDRLREVAYRRSDGDGIERVDHDLEPDKAGARHVRQG